MFWHSGLIWRTTALLCYLGFTVINGKTPQPIPWAKETLFQVLKSHPQDAGGTKSFGLLEDSSNFSATNMGNWAP